MLQSEGDATECVLGFEGMKSHISPDMDPTSDPYIINQASNSQNHTDARDAFDRTYSKYIRAHIGRCQSI